MLRFINEAIFRSSSAVEQEAVNFEVAGSNPVSGAIYEIEAELSPEMATFSLSF